MGPKTQSDASVVGNRLQLTFKERRGIFNSSGAKQTLEVEFQDSDSATKALLKLMGQKMDNSGQQGQQSPAQSNSSSVEPVEIGSSTALPALPVPTGVK